MIKNLHLTFNLKPLFFVLGALCCLFVSASEKELDAVQVQASNSSSTYSPHDFIGSHQSLDLEQYSSRFVGLSDILNQQSGIDIQSISGVGQYATPSIRGAEGQQVLVFNNGISLNSLNSGGADIGSIGLAGAYKIEIYRGLVPMELSPTAIGGAINIIYKEPSSNEGALGLALGNYGVNTTSLSQKYSKKAFNIQFNIENLSADNDFIYEEQKPVSSPSTPKNEPRYNNASDNLQLSSLINYTLSNRHQFTTYIILEESEREIAGIINTQNNKTYSSKDSKSIQIKHQLLSLQNSQLHTSYSLHNTSQIYDDRDSKIGLGSQHNQYDTLFQKFNMTYKLNFTKHSLILNQQYQYELFNNYYLDDPVSNTNNCADNDQCDSEFTRQQNSTGLRLELQALQNLFTNIQIVHIRNRDDAFSSDTSKLNSTYTSLVSGISYRFDDGITLESNASQQIRPPSSSEVYGDRGTTIGNPDLLAEKSQAIEVGFKHSTENFDFSVYGFIREVKDNISAQQDSRGVIKYGNIAKTTYQGLELSFSSEIANYLSYTTNITRQKGIINRHLLESLNGNEVGDHRKIFINQTLTYSSYLNSLSLEHTLERGGYYDNQNLLARKQKSQWNLSITRKFLSTSISFSGMNLSNQRVRDYPHSPVSGRTFFLKLKHQWSF